MLTLVLAGTATALATGLGAVPVFLLGRRAEGLRPALWGLAAGGVMTVASIAGLLLPALDEGSIGEAGAGMVAGIAFLLVSRAIVDRSELASGDRRGPRDRDPERPRGDERRDTDASGRLRSRAAVLAAVAGGPWLPAVAGFLAGALVMLGASAALNV